MKPRIYIAAVFTVLFFASCATTYQSATISRIEPSEKNEKISSQAIVYRYRIHGLQQMVISLDPETGLLQSDNPSFTQNELSKLRVKVVSLNGQMSVNGLKISQGEVLVVDLKKWYNFNGKGSVKDVGKYLSVLRFVSYRNPPAGENLCDFILTIEDPHGLTRATGLHVHGGFTDSL
jgi:hypothetical protein